MSRKTPATQTAKSKGLRGRGARGIASGPDGGLAALLGFVHQMLGSAADFALCISPNTAEAAGFGVLLSFEVERHGQDSCAVGVSRESRKTRLLKQYKYSANPEKYRIGSSELREIVRKLRKSEKSANREEVLPTELILCTNRPVTGPAKKLPDYKRIRHESYSTADAVAALESYARRFGVFNPDELSAGVKRATSFLFEVATTASHRLSKPVFEEHLVGHREPQPLTLAECAPRRLAELLKLGKHTLRLVPENLADRQALRAASMDFLNDAVVVFVGDGGCGKTTAMWQVFWQAVGALPPQALTEMMTAAESAADSVAEVIERWRGMVSAANFRSDTFALERVIYANPNGPTPVVLLGLDGVDEHAPQAWIDTVSRVFKFFWQMHVEARASGTVPAARLFVSCRKESDLGILVPNPTGAPGGGIEPRYVRFGEFTPDELLQLVSGHEGLDRRVAQRITEGLLQESAGAEFGSPTPFPAPAESGASSWSVLLRHPVLWRCFASLNSEDQSAILDGLPSGQLRLGGAFLAWFCERAARRTRINSSDLANALRHLANEFQGDETHRYGAWGDLPSVLPLTAEDSKRLYTECISSGVIYDIPPAGGAQSHRSWRWRHPFLVSYLRRDRGRSDEQRA
jgi:hypothetical protein